MHCLKIGGSGQLQGAPPDESGADIKAILQRKLHSTFLFHPAKLHCCINMSHTAEDIRLKEEEVSWNCIGHSCKVTIALFFCIPDDSLSLYL